MGPHLLAGARLAYCGTCDKLPLVSISISIYYFPMMCKGCSRRGSGHPWEADSAPKQGWSRIMGIQDGAAMV